MHKRPCGSRLELCDLQQHSSYLFRLCSVWRVYPSDTGIASCSSDRGPGTVLSRGVCENGEGGPCLPGVWGAVALRQVPVLPFLSPYVRVPEPRTASALARGQSPGDLRLL